MNYNSTHVPDKKTEIQANNEEYIQVNFKKRQIHWQKNAERTLKIIPSKYF